MATVEERAESGGRGVSEEVLRGFFREMLLIRRFEEKVEDRFRAGELPGFLHVAIGQEATATGVCAALEREDVERLLDDAQAGLIAARIPADGAELLVADVEAAFAEDDLVADVDEGCSQRPGLGIRGS